MTTHNLPAERAVIAALIRDSNPDHLLDHEIHVDLFTQDATRKAFTAICELLADGITPNAATLRQALDGATLIEVETSLSEHASAANLPAYVRLLTDCHREREKAAARQRLTQALANGAPLDELQPLFREAQDAAADSTQPPTILVEEYFAVNTATEDDLIDGYIPTGTVGLLFGDSQAYKSFLLLDMACHIATGRPWRGRDVRQGNALFIAGEGGNGLRRRVKAWYEYHDAPMGKLAISTVPRELCAPGDVEKLIGEIQRFLRNDRFRFIVLDTLNTHFGPGDENSTADMTRFRAAVLRLSHATSATVAIAAHVGHADKDRARGSRSLYQGVDWEFKLQRSGDYTTLTHTKAKDGPLQPPLSWQLIQQPLPWADSKGNPINGALLVPSELAMERTQGPHLTGQCRKALTLLQDLYQTRRQNLSDADHDPNNARVTAADWQEAMRDITEDRGSRRRIRQNLLNGGHVRMDGDFVYPSHPST